MSRPAPLIALSHDSVLDSLKTLDGWGYHQDSIYREYIFKTCPMAVSFITPFRICGRKTQSSSGGILGLQPG
jgi:pterin-4a-carbinolamine dehydratase